MRKSHGVKSICLGMLLLFVCGSPAQAEESDLIPLGLEPFLYVLEEQQNPYLGLEIFRHTIEEIGQSREIEKQEEVIPEVTQMIFVGDSRVVGMAQTAVYGYIGKEAIGYDWFVSEGMYQMLDMMNSWPDADVILCFGINDVANIGSYIAQYQALTAAYPDTRFWFMSVNPVQDAMASACGYFINSDMVNSFNSLLEQAFPDQYLDCCSYLLENGYGTSDGVHYDMGTYVLIQEYSRYLIEQKLQAKE